MPNDITAPHSFEQDVIECALDVGGIGYWARIVNYMPAEMKAMVIEVGDGDEENNAVHTIVASTIRKAVDALKKGHIEGLGDERRRARLIGESYLGSDDRDIDAEDADILVQIGLFGKVVYG